jgi:alpha-ribazole phosphatase
MRVYLIRHGRPEIAADVCYGRTDVTVSPEENARVVSALLPVLPSHAPVFSSPLRRCSELALRLATALGSGEVAHDRRLAEMHFGDWEMRSWEEIPRMQIDGWANDMTAYRPGGGESVEEVARRVCSFHQDMLSRNLESAIVVCHAGTMRLLSQHQHGATALEMARKAALVRHGIGYGELLILDC